MYEFLNTIHNAYTNLAPVIRKHGGKVDLETLYDELKKELNAKTIAEVPPERIEELYRDILILLKLGILKCEEEMDPESLEEYNVLILDEEAAKEWERRLKVLGT